MAHPNVPAQASGIVHVQVLDGLSDTFSNIVSL